MRGNLLFFISSSVARKVFIASILLKSFSIRLKYDVFLFNQHLADMVHAVVD